LNYSFTKILKPEDNFGPLLVELAASKFKPIETSPPQICQSMLSTDRFHSSIHFFSTILSTFIIHQITTSPQDFAPNVSSSPRHHLCGAMSVLFRNGAASGCVHKPCTLNPGNGSVQTISKHEIAFDLQELLQCAGAALLDRSKIAFYRSLRSLALIPELKRNAMCGWRNNPTCCAVMANDITECEWRSSVWSGGGCVCDM
jgi:hypothetical protein